MFEVFQGDDGQFYWHVKAYNGEVIAASEGYTRREDAERGFVDAVAVINRPALVALAEVRKADDANHYLPHELHEKLAEAIVRLGNS